MIPFEVVDGRGEAVLSDWELDAQARRSLVTSLFVLFQTDFSQARNFAIFKVKEPEIYYFKVRGSVQLRPRCCLGPERRRDEVTFLLRATERDGATIPADADARAAEALRELSSGHARRIRYRPMPPEIGEQP